MISKRRGGKWTIHLLAFLFPAAVMAVLCIVLKIYPFGGKTFLISDMSNQYVSFLSYFRTLFTGSNDMFYTFSKTLGGDMTGLFSYYLLSPFNFITLLFSPDNLPLAVDIIIISKLAACGFTFSIFVNKTYGARWSSLLFSAAYALMAYNIAYCFNIMWLDGVILLPLIILGINNIFRRRSALLYLFSLFAAVVTNYYIGFMLCLFSALYFIYRFIISLSGSTVKQTLKRIMPFVFSSIAAAGLAAAVLIPAFLSLQGGKALFSFEALNFTPNFPFPDMFSKLFTCAFNWEQEISGLPNMFCGIPVTILAIQYFFNSGIKLRERICSAALLGVLLVSFYISMFDLFWHGLNTPSWFLYRYSFVFTFLLIALAYRNFLSLGALKPRHIICGALVFVALVIFASGKSFDFLAPGSVYIDALLALLVSALVYAYTRACRRNTQRLAPPFDPAFSPVPVIAKPVMNKAVLIITALLALLQIGDAAVNAGDTIGKLNEVFCEDVSYFHDYALYNGQVFDSIKQNDAGLYRMEKTYLYNQNDSLLFDFPGITHFSSTDKEFVKTFIGKLGFRNNGNWVCYNKGSTAAADSLLGIKYLVTDTGTGKSYDIVSEQNGVTVYKNPYAFPLGFAASSDIEGVSLSAETSVFELQNHIFAGLAPQYADSIFTPAEVLNVSLVNASEQEIDGARVVTKTDASQDAYIDYEISITSPDMLYGYLYAPDVQEAELFIGDTSLGNYFDVYRWDAFPLGQFAEGETVTLRIKLLGDTLSLWGEDFYFEHTDALAGYYNALSGGFCSLNKISSSHIAGSVSVEGENKLLVFTIPYESAWNVYIDSSPVQTKPVLDTLLSVPVSPGQHSIELRYIPNGLYLGLYISGASLLVILIYIAFVIRTKRRENKKGMMIRF